MSEIIKEILPDGNIVDEEGDVLAPDTPDVEIEDISPDNYDSYTSVNNGVSLSLVNRNLALSAINDHISQKHKTQGAKAQYEIADSSFNRAYRKEAPDVLRSMATLEREKKRIAEAAIGKLNMKQELVDAGFDEMDVEADSWFMQHELYKKLDDMDAASRKKYLSDIENHRLKKH